MARGAIEIDVTAAGTVVLFSTNKRIRLREVGYYVTSAISGGTNFTRQVGYSGGAEIVASGTEATPTAADAEKIITGGMWTVPADNTVTFKITASSRTAGKICVFWETDNDF